MAGVLEMARNDWKKHITSTSGAGEDISVTTPDNATTVNVRGLAMSHHLNFDTEGHVVNSKSTHISISEKDLTDQGYVVRNIKNIVALHKHKISFADSTGVTKNYLIIQAYPDETVGLITCVLGNHE